MGPVSPAATFQLSPAGGRSSCCCATLADAAANATAIAAKRIVAENMLSSLPSCVGSNAVNSIHSTTFTILNTGLFRPNSTSRLSPCSLTILLTIPTGSPDLAGVIVTVTLVPGATAASDR